MVNVNTVYKTVLYILNKEQRGFITPDDFNTLGTQVQREIFEAYFEELNQQLRVPQNDSEYANRVSNLQEKIDIFNTSALCTGANPFTLPSDVHRIGSISYEGSSLVNTIAIQKVGRAEHTLLESSPLTKPSISYPVYIGETTGAPSAAPSQIQVYPTDIQSRVRCNYLKAPIDPRWGYSVGNLGQYVYDSTTYGANLLNIGTGVLTASITTNQTDFVNGTYTGTVGSTAGYSTSGAGTGLIISITVAGNTVTDIDITTAGSGYVVGDTITVTGSGGGVLGGATGNLVITLTAANFNSGSTYGSTQFELHPTEQTNLILQILMYSGVVIRDPQIIQTAATLVQQDEALEKS